MRKNLDKNTEDGDLRDAKIVSLAKKNRTITVMLNKERVSAESRGIQIQELVEQIQQLERTGSVLHRKDVNDKDSQQELVQLRRDLISSSKTIDDLRRKFFQSTEECKQLTRALGNELGEGVSIDRAVEGSWRGRAQQIIMLKSKIKKMESDSSSGGSSTFGNGRGKRLDVDTKAQEELAEMSLERKHAIESIVEEKDALTKSNYQLDEKLQAYKARIKNLEADSLRQKQQIKVVLDVKDGDDELIDALQKEIHRFKMQTKNKSIEGGNMGTMSTQMTEKAQLIDNEFDSDIIRCEQFSMCFIYREIFFNFFS